MTTCSFCNTIMIRTLSFSKDKQEKFFLCPKCHNETKRQNIRDGDLDFREELLKASIRLNNSKAGVHHGREKTKRIT